MERIKNEAAVELGRRGGLKTLYKWGKKHYSNMAKARHNNARRVKELSTVANARKTI